MGRLVLLLALLLGLSTSGLRTEGAVIEWGSSRSIQHSVLSPHPSVLGAPTYFTAQWDTANSATVSWFQSARGCLDRESAIGERVFVGCYERWPATIRVEFGHVGPLSGNQRPRGGDVYIVQTSGVVYRAPLVGRAVYLPGLWR